MLLLCLLLKVLNGKCYQPRYEAYKLIHQSTKNILWERHVNESNVPICCNCYYILIPVLNTGKVCSMKYAIL